MTHRRAPHPEASWADTDCRLIAAASEPTGTPVALPLQALSYSLSTQALRGVFG